ncbi:MAG: undecaprenyl/decaprenyl-phosphate alpha-N-acetylglucosaminyl 1-phosphate transferase [Phycisphaerales bacterium]|nr:undecaprenyl/decaprenyl-phosphate alpha-N-acetylglucosaminyl 1-phosphate transferase [Phycisphaerales bacterium]
MSVSLLVLVLLGMAAGVFALSVGLTAAVRQLALRINFVDRPGGHKSHRDPTPYGGGTAIFLSAAAALLALLAVAWLAPQDWIRARFGETARAYVGGVQECSGQVLVILLGALGLHLLGLLDDRRPLAPLPKLAAIVAASLWVSLVGEIRIAEAVFGPALSVVLTTAWFVVIVNAMNFLDNMDGLSAGVGAICLAFFAYCGYSNEQVLVPGLAGIFLGATGGFLLWNFPPARIFMGDGGSLVVGYALAVVSVLTTYFRGGGSSPYALATPLVILAVPLYDFASVVIIRWREGRSPMQGDQRHFSHRLVDRGLSRRYAVLTIYLATATTGLAATLLPGADLRTTLTVVAIVAMVLGIVAILEAPLRREA